MFSLINLNFLSVIFLILINLLLSYLSYSRNPKNKTNQLFSGIVILASAWVLFNFLENAPIDHYYSKLFLLLDFGEGLITIYLFFLLCLNFPKPTKVLSVFTEKLIAAPVILFAILMPTNFIIKNVRFVGSAIYFDSSILFPVYGFLAISLIVAGITRLFRFYRKSSGIEKVQTFYLLFGFLVSMFVVVVVDLILPNFFELPIYISRLGLYSTFFLTGATTYAIVRHRLLDIEVIIRRSVVYSALLASLTIFYSVLVFGLNRIFLPSGSASFPRPTDLLAIIIVAFTVDPLKGLIEKATDRVFFKGRYDAEEAISNISETISEVLDLNQLLDSLRLTLNRTLKVNKIAIYIRVNHHFEPVDKLGGFDEKFDSLIEKKYFLSKYFKDNQDLVITDELIRSLEDKRQGDKDIAQAVKFLKEADVEIIAPLVVKDQLTGALFLGEKLSQDIYTNEDIRLLEILSRQASIAL